jgi:hypothetical protein
MVRKSVAVSILEKCEKLPNAGESRLVPQEAGMAGVSGK